MLPKACREVLSGSSDRFMLGGCARHKPSSPMVATCSCVELCHVRSFATAVFSGALRLGEENAQFCWFVVFPASSESSHIPWSHVSPSLSFAGRQGLLHPAHTLSQGKRCKKLTPRHILLSNVDEVWFKEIGTWIGNGLIAGN